jgi:hypothetical protein
VAVKSETESEAMIEKPELPPHFHYLQLGARPGRTPCCNNTIQSIFSFMPKKMQQEEQSNQIAQIWCDKLEVLLQQLEAMPVFLAESQASSLGIQMSDLDLENDISFESSPGFFIPLPRERLPVSTCDINVENHQSTHLSTLRVNLGDYGHGLHLAGIIEDHRTQLSLFFDVKVPRWQGMR